MQHVLGLPFMTLALLGVSIIQFPVAIFLRRHLYFGKEFDDAEERYAGYQTMSLVSWSFAESFAIYGLINAFLGTPLSQYAIFYVMSIGAFLLFRPQDSHLRPDA
jgi:hypothetical protein